MKEKCERDFSDEKNAGSLVGFCILGYE